MSAISLVERQIFAGRKSLEEACARSAAAYRERMAAQQPTIEPATISARSLDLRGVVVPQTLVGALETHAGGRRHSDASPVSILC